MTETLDVIHFNEYGVKSEVIAESPLRVHLVGEHSWFFGDRTLAVAVSKYAKLSFSKRSDSTVNFFFYQNNEHKHINLGNLKIRKEDKLLNILKAVVYACQNLEYNISGMDITFSCEVPPQAGFGVRNAMLVASTLGVMKLFGLPSDTELALKIMKIACVDYLSLPYWISDLYTALYSKKGSCVLTDYATGTYEHIPFDFEDSAIILTDCKVPRISLWQENSLHIEKYRNMLASLKKKKMGQIVYEDSVTEINEVLTGITEEERRRLLCIIKEYQNVNDAVLALKNKSLNNFVKVINRSQDILRDLFQISSPEVDWFAKRVQEFDAGKINDASACLRITGKGDGRCTFAFMKKSDVEIYRQKLVEYEKIFGFHPIEYEVETADGARSYFFES
ncbi:MAG: galactokinase [Treponemataceae bacterium]|nr:galactokinase [Treponemataceae bacterium]